MYVEYCEPNIEMKINTDFFIGQCEVDMMELELKLDSMV